MPSFSELIDWNSLDLCLSGYDPDKHIFDDRLLAYHQRQVHLAIAISDYREIISSSWRHFRCKQIDPVYLRLSEEENLAIDKQSSIVSKTLRDYDVTDQMPQVRLYIKREFLLTFLLEINWIHCLYRPFQSSDIARNYATYQTDFASIAEKKGRKFLSKLKSHSYKAIFLA